jgi:transcription elongation factor GreA
VSIGATIVVNVGGKERRYTIVGSNEANPSEGKISNESLVGKALLSKRVGDKVPITTPAGETIYEIVSIE